MITSENIEQLKNHGIQMMRSRDTFHMDMQDLMCVVICEIVVAQGQAEAIRTPRALFLSQDEVASIMNSGLAGMEPPEEAIDRWHKAGSVVYHNFLLSSDGSQLITESMSAAPLMIGNSVELEEYATELIEVLAPYTPELAHRETQERFTEESLHETLDLIEKLKNRRLSDPTPPSPNDTKGPSI